MARALEIARDLDVRANRLNCSNDNSSMELARMLLGASTCIRDQEEKISELEMAAERESLAFERYRGGDDI